MFRTSRQELLNTLARVAPGLSSSDFIEQSTCYAFDSGWVCTFNDEICCRTKTGLPDDVRGAVRAKQLVAVLENMDDDHVDVSADGKEFKIRGNRKRAGVRMEAEIVLPFDQVESPDSWEPLDNDFPAAVKQVVGAAGTNDEEFLTVCVHVHPDFLEASDRKQLCRFTLPTGVTRPFLVRAASLRPTADLGLTKIGETDNWVHFRNKLLVYSCRRHLEDYPDLGALLKFRGTPVVLPQGAPAAAKLGGVFTADDKENDKVTVSMAADKMTVRGDGRFGWAEADLEMAYKGAPVTFRVAPAMLVKLVAENKECEIGPDKLTVVGEKWRYLTVLGKPVVETSDTPADEPVAETADA